MLNLDTHIVLFAVLGQLTLREQVVLAEDSTWGISAIVLWEIAKLAQLRRIDFDLDVPEMSDFISRLEILPIDLRVCRALKQLDFKGDPADEIIAATSLARDIPLLTRDKALRRSKIVPLAAARK